MATSDTTSTGHLTTMPGNACKLLSSRRESTQQANIMTEVNECIRHKFEEGEDYKKIKRCLTNQVFHCVLSKTARSEIAKARSCAELVQVLVSKLQQLERDDLIKFLELTEKYLWPNQINQSILKLEALRDEPTTKKLQSDTQDLSKDLEKPSEELTKIRDEKTELVLCKEEKTELIVGSTFSVPEFEEGGIVTGVGHN